MRCKGYAQHTREVQIGCGSHSGQIAVNVLKPDCQELT